MTAPTDALALAERLEDIWAHGLLSPFERAVLARSAADLCSLTADVERVTRERDDAQRSVDMLVRSLDKQVSYAAETIAALHERVKALEGALRQAREDLYCTRCGGEGEVYCSGWGMDTCGECEGQPTKPQQAIDAALSPDAQVPVGESDSGKHIVAESGGTKSDGSVETDQPTQALSVGPSDTLRELLAKAKDHELTPEEIIAQRESWGRQDKD